MKSILDIEYSLSDPFRDTDLEKRLYERIFRSVHELRHERMLKEVLFHEKLSSIVTEPNEVFRIKNYKWLYEDDTCRN